jgi:hypothetical protein
MSEVATAFEQETPNRDFATTAKGAVERAIQSNSVLQKVADNVIVGHALVASRSAMARAPTSANSFRSSSNPSAAHFPPPKPTTSMERMAKRRPSFT